MRSLLDDINTLIDKCKIKELLHLAIMPDTLKQRGKDTENINRCKACRTILSDLMHV